MRPLTKHTLVYAESAIKIALTLILLFAGLQVRAVPPDLIVDTNSSKEAIRAWIESESAIKFNKTEIGTLRWAGEVRTIGGEFITKMRLTSTRSEELQKSFSFSKEAMPIALDKITLSAIDWNDPKFHNFKSSGNAIGDDMLSYFYLANKSGNTRKLYWITLEEGRYYIYFLFIQF